MRALRIAQPYWTPADIPSILTRMCKPACYGLIALRYGLSKWRVRHVQDQPPGLALPLRQRSRRLNGCGKCIRQRADGQYSEPSNKLRTLIDVHKTAYSFLGEALHEIGGGRSDSAKASREEERALLAICGYSAVGEGDRLAKARYLLEIEARGELDLAEHIYAGCSPIDDVEGMNDRRADSQLLNLWYAPHVHRSNQSLVLPLLPSVRWVDDDLTVGTIEMLLWNKSASGPVTAGSMSAAITIRTLESSPAAGFERAGSSGGRR